MTSTFGPTDKQIAYVRGMQRRLHLTNALLDNHCQQQWAAPFAELPKDLVSRLIDEMVQWDRIPAQLLREAGQTDMFEVMG